MQLARPCSYKDETALRSSWPPVGSTMFMNELKCMSPLWQWRGRQAAVGKALGVRHFRGRHEAFIEKVHASWVLERE